MSADDLTVLHYASKDDDNLWLVAQMMVDQGVAQTTAEAVDRLLNGEKVVLAFKVKTDKGLYGTTDER